ncbi:MAG TPA: C-GCAxxG-C-C family protein [Bacteroidales bacterium]|nr:C-GCAxxG-C-C family protein [Bacteroidales bacterium]
MEKSDKALGYFRNKLNCSQAVFASLGQDSGISEDECLKIGCAFGGGMGRQQYTCGAVTGALMAIGLKHGKAMNDPDDKKEDTYNRTRDFFQKFKEMNGSVNCKDLLEGLDMNDPDDHRIIMEKKLFDIKCEKYVKDAVRLAESII